MANSCRGKAVLLTVYVEKPRRRSSSQNKHLQHHHHHYLHQINRHAAAGGNQGYNRRAQLLQYSQSLRNHSSSTNHPPKTNQIVAVKRKPKYGWTPTCLGNWKISVQSLFRSLTSLQSKQKTKKNTERGSTSNKIKAVMKSLKMPRKKGFLSNLFGSIHKRR